VLVPLAVVPEVARGEELCDEVDAAGLLIVPGTVTLDDIGVVQVDALLQLLHYRAHLIVLQPIGVLQDAAPSNVYALLLVEALVNMLEATRPDFLAVPARPGG
jgi:hypothetical protein